MIRPRVPALVPTLGLVLLTGACGTTEQRLPGPTRGTWLLQEGMEGRSVTVTDTSVRIDVEAGAFGSATLTLRTTEHRVRRDHERVRFDRVTVERFDADTLTSGLLLTRDSTVLWRPDLRRVFTAADSVLSNGGRLVLAPRADSSLDVALPTGLLRGTGEQGVPALGTIPWPDSAGILEAAERWTVIRYDAFRP